MRLGRRGSPREEAGPRVGHSYHQGGLCRASFQNIMFYDMGSGSTVCTIVTYQTVKTKEAGMQPQLQIRGVG